MKTSKVIVSRSIMNDIGQAIIDKGGSSGPLYPRQMPSAIRSIPGSSSEYMKYDDFSSLPTDDLLPEETGIEQLCDLVNQMKNLLKHAPVVLAALIVAFHTNVFASSIQTARLVDLVGRDTIVTNVVFTDSINTNEVKSIVDSEVGGTNTLVHALDLATYIDGSITNGWDSVWATNLIYKATNNFVTSSITNGFIKEEWITAKKYIESDKTNDWDSVWATNLLYKATNDFVTASITNGFVKEEWLTAQNYIASDKTNGWGSVWATNFAYLVTNGFVTASITNDLASEQWILNQHYIEMDRTNGWDSIWATNFAYVVTNNFASKTDLGSYLSTTGGVVSGDITFQHGVQIIDEQGHNVLKSNDSKNYLGVTNDILRIEGKDIIIDSDRKLEIQSTNISVKADAAVLKFNGTNLVDIVNDQVKVLSSKTNDYDFASMKGVYQALKDIIESLGGSVTNYPDFN